MHGMRRHHDATVKARVALEAIKGEKTVKGHLILTLAVIEKLPPGLSLGLFDLGLFDEPGLDLLPEAVGVAFNVDCG